MFDKYDLCLLREALRFKRLYNAHIQVTFNDPKKLLRQLKRIKAFYRLEAKEERNV